MLEEMHVGRTLVDRSCHLQGTLTLSGTWDIQVDIYDQRQLGKDSEEDQRWKIDLNSIITWTLIKIQQFF